MTSAVPLGFLNCTQQDATVSSIESGWDLMIASVSWESRAAALLPLLANTKAAMQLFRFESSSPAIQARKELTFKQFEAALGSRLNVVNLQSSSTCEFNFRQIRTLIEDAYATRKRALRVLLDATCLPKKYLLYIMGVSFRREYVAKLGVLYAEGKYVAPKSAASTPARRSQGLISDGDWVSIQIPFLESSDYAPNKRDVVVSLGGEVGVAVPLIERLEPRRLRLIQIREDGARVPKRLLEKESRYVSLLLGQPGATIQEYDLNNATGVALDIIKQCEGPTTCVAIGSKPHAIAMGLAALADDRIDVVCRVPGGYTAADAVHTGRTTYFDIEDRFEPSAYL